MQDLIFQATQWRAELSLVICLTVAYVSLRCLWAAARTPSSPRRRRLVACGVGSGLLAPMATASALGATPALVAVGLVLLAGGCGRRKWANALLTGSGIALLAASTSLLASGRVVTLGSGPSMWPTSARNFSVLVIEPGLKVQRGSRVEFQVPLDQAGSDPDTQWPAGRYHKRVLGLAGDRVDVEEYSIFVNGERVADCHPEYSAGSLGGGKWLCNGLIRRQGLAPVAYQMTWGQPGIWMNGRQSWILGPGQALVLGDNLVESGDSRHRGPIRAEWITGVVAGQ